MDIIAQTFNRHNAEKACYCPSCNITRMCEEMRVMTERTNDMLAKSNIGRNYSRATV